MVYPYEMTIKDGRVTVSFDVSNYGLKSIDRVEVDDLDEELASEMVNGEYQIAIGIGVLGRVVCPETP